MANHFCFSLAAVALFAIAVQASGESTASDLDVQTTAVMIQDPTEPAQGCHGHCSEWPCSGPLPPVDVAAYLPRAIQFASRQANYQTPSGNAAPPASAQANVAKDPCAAMVEKPLAQIGIGIAMPAGDFPADPASACWNQLNQVNGTLAGTRCWPTFVYDWDATGLCHRPLYFEEINLERYGYGCDYCLQPLASAAHFFGTVPALPYCIAAECPTECVYTLGHYRPGSCPPKRYHWPPCDPLAAAAEGGVWTGLIFLIP